MPTFVADSETRGLWSFMRNTKKIRHKPEEGGIYLDDLKLDEMDPEVAALYFPKKYVTTAIYCAPTIHDFLSGLI